MTDYPLPDYLTDDRLRDLVAEHRDVLLPLGTGVVTESVATATLARLAHEAYLWGRHRATAELMTTDAMAAALGLSAPRVRALAKSRGVGWQIGRDWLFRQEDIEGLRVRRPGRPKAMPA